MQEFRSGAQPTGSVIFQSRLQRRWRKSATHPATVLCNLGQSGLQYPAICQSRLQCVAGMGRRIGGRGRIRPDRQLAEGDCGTLLQSALENDT